MSDESETEMIRKETAKRDYLVDNLAMMIKFSVAAFTGPLAVWATAMKPYIEKSVWPPMLALVGEIWPGMLAAFIAGAGGYVSNSFGQWKESRKSNNGPSIESSTKP